METVHLRLDWHRFVIGHPVRLDADEGLAAGPTASTLRRCTYALHPGYFLFLIGF